MAGKDEGSCCGVGIGNISPAGKEITWTGMDFVRIANGRLVEVWSNQGILGMLCQLNVIHLTPTQEPGSSAS